MVPLVKVCCMLSLLFNFSNGFAPRKVVRINPIDHMPMIDDLGRERYFHGMNVVYKQKPYVPIIDSFHAIKSFGYADIQIFKNLSWNIVRLGVMWPGLEPERLQINETYIQEIEEIVKRLHNAGIYVLLDFHQDLLSEKFCGEGVPLWAALPEGKQFPIPVEDQPYRVDVNDVPSQADCDRHNWPEYHGTYATSTGFQSLYDNKEGVQEALAKYWITVAQRFGHYENVLGYNLINEPWAGDVFKNPTLLVPGVADKLNLQPMYEILNTAIRSVDNVSLIIFESVTWDNFVFGFTQAPGGEKFADRSVFGYHYYRLPRVTSMDAAMKFQLKKSQNLSCGGMLTEFDTAAGNSEIILSTSTADEHLQSWIGWEYKPLANITGWGFGVVDENGHLNKPLATNLSRPYATAVAGYVTVMKYSDVTNTFKLRYLIDKTTTGPTEIFISRNYHYPNGFNVTVTPAYFANYTEVNDGIEVYHKSEAIHNADLLVEITPV